MENIDAIVGNCKQMCPSSEIKMREQQRLLHPMEVHKDTQEHRCPKADLSKVVKEFCRSSAGQRMQNADVLRPYPVLMDTVSYLLNEAMLNEKFPWHVRYDFIMDRLRAVRQDMVIQDLPKPQAICLLQPIVRFYAYTSYKLANNKWFEPHLHNKHFQECLKRLLAIYDECEQYAEHFNFLNYDAIYHDCRPQIEAIYILFNIGDDEALQRALSLAPRWKQTSLVHSALKISLLYRNKNFVAVCRRMAQLPGLSLTVAVLHLPVIRRRCLQTMTHAYNSKNLQFPLEKLKDILLYSSVGDLIADLGACGIVYNVNWDKDIVVSGGVTFTKGQFNAKTLASHDTQFVEEILQDVCVEDIVLMGF